MTNPCPYCATALEGETLVTCRGCGNPVALSATRKEIATIVKAKKGRRTLRITKQVSN